MTRRLTLTLTLVVLAAVTVSTVLTITAAFARSRATTRDHVTEVATALVRRSAHVQVGQGRLPAYCGLAVLSRAFRLETVTCVEVATDGQLAPLSGASNRVELPFPDDVLPERVDAARVAAGDTVTGSARRQVWALLATRSPDRTAGPAGPAGRGGPIEAVVVTRRIENPLAALGLRWLVLSAALTTGGGLLAARLLGRRLAEPLRRATAATHHLAAGQLDVRLPVDAHARPGDELDDLSRSINALGESLQRSRGLEQRFLLSVSHDLRTPLTSIRGFADALADGTLTDVAFGASVIRRESTRLERLVGDLLDLAKLDARSFRFELRRVDVTQVARGLTEALAPEAATAGVHLQLRDPAAPPADALADADRVAQVVANLVDNAMRFAATRVVLDTGVDPSDDRWVLLHVVDDGPGIAPEDLPHVFERLYVARRVPTRKEAGSGLGLAIVRELVEAMGGQVTAHPAEPHGTSVAVRLPRWHPVDAPGTPGTRTPGAA